TGAGNDRVEAHRLAVEGHKAFPDSPGGERCLTILKRIEAPDFQLTSMANDGPNRRSVSVAHRTLNGLYFRAYPIDLFRRISEAEVMLYRYDWQRKHGIDETRRSDLDGRVTFAAGNRENGSRFLVARRGDDIALDSSGLGFGRPGRETPVNASFVYTDRSIY